MILILLSVSGILKEEYRKLEVLAFEMESTIASLEEELAAAKHENEGLILKSGSLASEQEEQSEKINLLNLELSKLHEEIHVLVRFCIGLYLHGSQIFCC